MTPRAAAPGWVLVWPVALRFFHWALAVCITGCLLLYTGGPWHERLGYGALALVLWRCVWGLVARRPQLRFAGFVPGLGTAWAHARAMWARREPRHLGHNPLGGWMIVALLAAAGTAAVSGALYATDQFWGDEAVYAVHRIAGWSLLGLVPLHLAGVLVSSWLQRENLVRAMLTGRKRPAGPGDIGLD